MPIEAEERLTKMLKSLVFILILVSSAFGVAQAPMQGKLPPEETVSAWLRSGEPRLVAWGAADALKMQDAALVPEMVGLMRQWVNLPKYEANGTHQPWSVADRERQLAMAEVLDTLIQMKATVDLDAVRSIETDFPDQAIILVARMRPEMQGAIVMPWFEAADDPRALHVMTLRRAAAAMLALHPVPGFTAELVRGITVHLTLAVVSGNSGIGMGFGSGDCAGAGVPLPLSEWPQIWWDSVRETYPNAETDKAEVLIDGVDAIHVVRGPRPLDRCPTGLWLDDRRRARLLAQMLKMKPEDLTWRQGPVVRIAYENDAQYVADVRRVLDEKLRMFRATAQQMRDAGLITSEEETNAVPRLQVRVWDQRDSATERPPLPELTAPAANVEWEKGYPNLAFDSVW